jgi:hypothetical protein
MVSQKRSRKSKFPERQFVLRIPEDQAVFLDHLVEMRLHRSLNESIVKIIDAFIIDLKKSAEEAQK